MAMGTEIKSGDGNVFLGTIPRYGRPLARRPDGKRAGPVEDVIAWAFREELPKMPKRDAGPAGMAAGWNKTSRYGELLSLVDLYGVNQYGVVPDFSSERWPSADALAIADAVAALDDAELEMPEDWSPAPELDVFAGLGGKAISEAWRRMTRTDDGRQVLRSRPSELIIRAAVLGPKLSDMALEGTAQRYESHGNGKAKWFIQTTMDVIVGSNRDGSDITEPTLVEVNGWNSKHQRPLPGAYRKPYLDPDPVPVIIARAEYEIWLSALVLIQEQLAGRLETVEMLPSSMTPAPWMNAQAVSRVLPDLVAEHRIAAEAAQTRREAFRARFPRWFANLERLAKATATPA